MGTKIRMISSFSSETMKLRREWSEILKTLREKSHQPEMLYPVKSSFESEGEIKTFSDRKT